MPTFVKLVVVRWPIHPLASTAWGGGERLEGLTRVEIPRLPDERARVPGAGVAALAGVTRLAALAPACAVEWYDPGVREPGALFRAEGAAALWAGCQLR